MIVAGLNDSEKGKVAIGQDFCTDCLLPRGSIFPIGISIIMRRFT